METTIDEDMDDIEMMDIEDTPILPSNDLPNKRKLNSVCETNAVLIGKNASPKNSLKPQSRHVLKARRVLPKSLTNCIESNRGFSVSVDESLKPICVLDTNILLSNLTELKSLIISEEKLRERNQSKLKSILIPWIVVQELDGLKNRPNDKSVVNVIRFINEQLKRSNGLVKGENKSKTLSPKSRKVVHRVEEETNDDKIINCCLMSKTQDSSDVIVVSNDLNLCNKALMNDLIAMNWREFHQKYYSSDISHEISSQKRASNSSEDIEEDIEPKHKRIHSRKPSNSSLESHNTSKPQSSRSMQIIRKPKSTTKKIKSQTKSLSETSSHDNNSGDYVDRRVPQNYDEWIRFKDECEQSLIKFVEHVYRNAWDKDWKRMLEIDVNNTDLKALIRLMRKEWMALFSDHFGRDNNVKQLIETIHKSLHKSQTNYHLFYKDLRKLFELVKQTLNI